MVGIAGAVTAGLLKLALTGQLLTPGEAARDTFVTGFLAATVSDVAVWLAPVSWPDLLSLSAAGAMTFLGIYHLANVYRLATSGRHLSTVGGVLCTSTPFVFGLLLLLQTGELVGEVGCAVSFGLAFESPAIYQSIGRAVEKLFSEKIERILVEVIETAVAKEIAEFKKMVISGEKHGKR